MNASLRSKASSFLLAIIGTALYVGNFTLTEALELTRISSKEDRPV